MFHSQGRLSLREGDIATGYNHIFTHIIHTNGIFTNVWSEEKDHTQLDWGGFGGNLGEEGALPQDVRY